MSTPKRSLADRFWDQVCPEPNSGCWLWLGTVDRKGYGQIGLGGRGGRKRGAHRVSLELHGIEVPEDKLVLHKCDMPPCVNPEHLYVGTCKDNARDMRSRNRWHRINPPARGWKRTDRHWNYGKRLTHCCRGHELVDQNVFYQADGHRRCRLCRNQRDAANRLRITMEKQT